ncbi:MAG: hypothetical protein LBS05_09300 [Tannerellaceae bacterium]|nr:hypothetical protein [Tannerellaceae bacterium]
MKKIHIPVFLILIALAMLTSCGEGNKKDVDIQYQLTVSVDVRNVVKDLVDIYGVDYFPNGELDDDDYSVRINLFIYDDEGSLVEKESQIVDDFYQKLEVKKSMNTGEYTLVATADLVEVNGDDISLEFWKFSNTSNLRDLRAVEQGYAGYYYKALGVTKEVVEIEKSQSLTMNVKPAGALVTFYFTDLDASTMASLVYEWDRDADYYLIDDEVGKIDKATVLSYTYEVKKEYTGLYQSRYYIPSEIEFTWGTFTADEKLIKSGSTTLNIHRGVNQILTINVQTGSTSLKSDTRAPQQSLPDVRNERPDPTAPQQSLRIIDLL